MRTTGDKTMKIIRKHVLVAIITNAVLLLGTYASRVDRANVADLLARLRTAKPDELQPMLARVLADPTLQLSPRSGHDVQAEQLPTSGAQVCTVLHSEEGRELAAL